MFFFKKSSQQIFKKQGTRVLILEKIIICYFLWKCFVPFLNLQMMNKCTWIFCCVNPLQPRQNMVCATYDIMKTQKEFHNVPYFWLREGALNHFLRKRRQRQRVISHLLPECYLLICVYVDLSESCDHGEQSDQSGGQHQHSLGSQPPGQPSEQRHPQPHTQHHGFPAVAEGAQKEEVRPSLVVDHHRLDHLYLIHCHGDHIRDLLQSRNAGWEVQGVAVFARYNIHHRDYVHTAHKGSYFQNLFCLNLLSMRYQDNIERKKNLATQSCVLSDAWFRDLKY